MPSPTSLPVASERGNEDASPQLHTSHCGIRIGAFWRRRPAKRRKRVYPSTSPEASPVDERQAGFALGTLTPQTETSLPNLMPVSRDQQVSCSRGDPSSIRKPLLDAGQECGEQTGQQIISVHSDEPDTSDTALQSSSPVQGHSRIEYSAAQLVAPSGEPLSITTGHVSLPTVLSA